MRRLIYWMLIEILFGIWLFFSPWVLGFRESGAAAANSLVLGALLILLGVGITLYAVYVGDRSEGGRKRSEAGSA